MNKIDFIEWLEGEIKKRDMSRADLARASGLSAAQITRILNGEQSPGNEAIVMIARALNKPPEEVFLEVVGLRPRNEDRIANEAAYLVGLLSDDRKNQVIEYLRVMVQIDMAEKKNK